MRPLAALALLLAGQPSISIAQPDPGSYPTIEVAPPMPFLDEPQRPPTRDPRVTTATYYASAYGVTEEEARRRARLQREVVPEISRIRPLIEREQAGNYADIWIEHRPEWRVVVAFARDPEATLLRYTRNPLFVARQVEHSLAELNQAADDAFAQLRRLGIPAAGGVEVMENRVSIGVDVEQDELDALIRDGRLRVSPLVRLTGPPALGAEAVSPEAQRFMRVFPRARFRTGMETQELNVGTIVLRDGCLRLDRPGDDDPFAFFGAESGLKLDEAGMLTIYRRDGQALEGHVGEQLVLGGGAGAEINDSAVLAPIHVACGPGPVAYVGNPHSYARFRERYSSWEVDQRAEREGIGREEARRQLRACWADQDAYWTRVRREGPSAQAGPQPPSCDTPVVPPPPARR